MGAPPGTGDDQPNRRRGVLYAAPLLLAGLFNVVLLFGWGLEPLWAFAILPPTVFLTAICWLAFRHGVGPRSSSDAGGTVDADRPDLEER